MESDDGDDYDDDDENRYLILTPVNKENKDRLKR